MIRSYQPVAKAKSFRVSSRMSEPRSSSNRSFSDQVQTGIRTGARLGTEALRKVVGPLPGGAALANTVASVSNDGLDPNSNIAETDLGSLQESMIRKNQELLKKQVEVNEESSRVNFLSAILKKRYESRENVIRNISR